MNYTPIIPVYTYYDGHCIGFITVEEIINLYPHILNIVGAKDYSSFHFARMCDKPSLITGYISDFYALQIKRQLSIEVEK